MNPIDFAEVAPVLTANGYPVVPVERLSKRPLVSRWPSYRFSEGDAQTYAGCGCGILTARFPALDIDVRHAPAAQALADLAAEVLGPAPCRIGQPPKRLLLYGCSAPFRKRRSRAFVMPGDDPAAPGYRPHAVEFLADGQQFVAFGVHPDTRKPYRWNGLGDPRTVAVGLLPQIDEAMADEYLRRAEALLVSIGRPFAAEPAQGPAAPDRPEADIAEGGRNVTLASLAGTMRRRGMNADEIAAALMAVNARRCKPPLDEAQVRTIAASVARYAPASGLVAPPAEGDVVIVKNQPLTLSEDNLALAFAREYAGQILFNHTTDRWHVWTGSHWQREETGLAFEWARQFTRALNTDGKAKWAKASVFRAVESLARTDRAFARIHSDFDRDPWVVGTPGGLVDLRTGTLRPAQPEDMLTRVCGCTPAEAGRPAPRWQAFLQQATGDDAGLIRFLQQVCGYALTGVTIEHVLVFIFGSGGNGKGVFLDTIAGVFGDYAQAAAIATFTASKHERHSTEIAHLAGARLVTASETETGHAWAESRIKMLTGGDKVRARFLYREEFEFLPQFQLIIVGNHKPRLKAVDDAMRRRLNLVDFKFRPATVNPRLRDELREEWPQILRWAIEGCLDWQRHGLALPQCVIDATAEYFAEQDLVGAWVADCCELGARFSTPAAALFKAWSAWAKAAGEDPGTQTAFGDRLNAMGVYAKKTKTVTQRLGIRLLTPAGADPRFPGEWD